MKAQDFLDWMDAVNISKAVKIVRLLGVSRNMAQLWVANAQDGKDVEIKRTVALTMRATAKNQKPLGES